VRRGSLAASLLVVLALSACGSSVSPRQASSVPWQPPAGCAEGTPGCVDGVVAEMERRLDGLAAACDHDAPFALMYLRVTQAVRRGERSPGAYADAAYLARLDAGFARLYFDAFDAWHRGRRAHVPDAWQVAFELADRGRVTGVGDLLLGMNAHISRDLPFAVAGLGFQPGRRSAQQESFSQVNGVLERVARPMLRETARRFDPTIATFALPVLGASEGNLGILLGGWRATALRDAERLLDAPTAERRAAVARSIERTAAARAGVIAAATSRASFSKAGRARDAYCRAR
jgi:hypothetical protein